MCEPRRAPEGDRALRIRRQVERCCRTAAAECPSDRSGSNKRAGWCPPPPVASTNQAIQTALFARGILQRVIDPDAVLLQKSIELVAGLDTEKTLQFRFRDSVFAIRLGCNHLQSCTRQVAPAGREP